jgi:hypothetical protein
MTMSDDVIGEAMTDSEDGEVIVNLSNGLHDNTIEAEVSEAVTKGEFVEIDDNGRLRCVDKDGQTVIEYNTEQVWSSECNDDWFGVDRSEYKESKDNYERIKETYLSEEENNTMQVYQAVAIKTDDDGDRQHIIRSTMLLAESEQKARDKFVQELDEEYEAGSDDIELTTFL